MRSERRWQAQTGCMRWGLVAAGVLIALAAAFFAATQPHERAFTLRVDGQELRLQTKDVATVGQALTASGVTLGPLDRVSPPITSSLSSSVISIVRVQISETVHAVAIPFARLSTDDPSRPRGFRQIVQPGAAGSKDVREAVTLEDGVEVGRRVISEQVTREPVAERSVVGARADPALDAFRESALGYLGRGGVTRLTAAVVEQTVFELSRLRGDRYGSVRVLSANGRPWLVLSTFARGPDDVDLLVFWWTDELHAFGQVLSEGFYLLDARAEKTDSAIELGLVVSPGQGNGALAPQFVLHRLAQTPQPADTWQTIWTSQGNASWRSSQGSVAFSDEGLGRLEVRGAASTAEASGTSALSDCLGCPRRRFESIWQRQGDAYSPLSQGVIASPYAILWAFVENLHSGSITATLPLVTDTAVISSALKAGLARPDLHWATSGSETDISFDLRSQDISLRVTLAARGAGWVVTSIGPIPAQGRILFTGTRPVVRGLFSMDTTASAPPRSLGDGQRYVWSPDYARVAYDWQGVVYVADGDGGNARTIGAGASPAWSPDSKRLAFERPSGKGTVIFIANLDDGRETALVSGSQPAWAPATGAGSQRIAFSYSASAASSPAVYVIDVATGASVVLASDGSNPLWSPDGGAVAFMTARQEIAVVTLTPGRVSTVGAGWGYVWSGDGKRLAFLSARPAGQVLVWDREKGEASALLERSDVDGLSWSPDGTEVVLSIAGGGGLWLAEGDGSDPRKLGDGRDPAWAWQPRAGR